MSASRSLKSHAIAWVFAVIIAVPVLYALSCGVLFYYASKEVYKTPGWMIAYWTPYEWLKEIPPLEKPLETFGEWCIDKGWEAANSKP